MNNNAVPMYGFGGGGKNTSELNFDVKAYSTEEEMLASNPKENTIGIVTDTPITGWEFYIAGSNNPIDGCIWINYVQSGQASFNAIKKNKIELCPTEVKQYINNEWVYKKSYIYKNGEWIVFFSATINITYPSGSTCTATDGVTTLTAPDTSGTWDCVVPNAGAWAVKCTNRSYTTNTTVSITSNRQIFTLNLFYGQYLFKDGNQYTDITGGWVSTGYYKQENGINVDCGNLSVKNNTLTLKYVDGRWALAGTCNKINLNEYNTLRFVITASSNDSYFSIRNDGRYVLPGSAMVKRFASPGTYDLDISSADGSYYITFYLCSVSEVLLKR